MSQAWQIHPNVRGTSWRLPNALDNLELRDVEKPVPTPGTALVRMHAVAVNSRDLQVIAYDPVYPTKAQTGISPCSDGAGVVEAAGDGSIWTKGDRVILAQNSWVEGNDEVNFDITSGLGGGGVPGALVKHKVVGDAHLFRAPANLTLEEAASLPTAGGIAAHALFFGPIPTQEETTVLTQGTGGVSTFAIQVCVTTVIRYERLADYGSLRRPRVRPSYPHLPLTKSLGSRENSELVTRSITIRLLIGKWKSYG